MLNLSVIQEFPSDFIFGVATSSYQIEGNKNGDCGLSIWDDFARKKLNGIDGKEACRHLDFFKEDIKLIKDAGFKSYRFSFSWPRLFPEKNQKLNNLGLDFYNRLLDEIHKQELEPYPTLIIGIYLSVSKIKVVGQIKIRQNILVTSPYVSLSTLVIGIIK